MEKIITTNEEYERYEKDFYSLGEIFKKCPSLNISFENLIDILPKLEPRYYSISSSPLPHPSSVHITVAVVEFENGLGRFHRGVCSKWLDCLPVQSQIPVFVRTSSFKLPKDLSTPVIMVGPGILIFSSIYFYLISKFNFIFIFYFIYFLFYFFCSIYFYFLFIF